MNVTKKDLIDSLKKNSDLGNTKADEFVNLFFNKIKHELQKNKSVKISGFGTFEVIHTKQRIGRNPKTKEPKVISSREVVLFKPSNEFKEFINNKND